jgi:hypothetical protein
MVDEMTPEARCAFLTSGTRTATLATTQLSRSPDDIDRVAPGIAERYDGSGGIEEFVRFAHDALGTLVRVRPTKIVALDRVSEH